MKKSGRIIIQLQGPHIQRDEITLIQHPLVLGIILLPQHYLNKTQLKKLIGEIQYIASLAGKKDMPIFTDHEGGEVQWLKHEFTHLPHAKTYGVFYNMHPKLGCILANYFGQIMARELQAFGVIPLGPVLDLDLGNEAISKKHRAFHHNPIACLELAKAFVSGMGDIPATGKHFPDLSQPIGDPHTQQTTDPRPLEDITSLSTYQRLADQLKAIMPTHTIYPKVDSYPVALSKTWLSLLRDQIKFTGVILSDCLSMKGSGSETLLDKTKNYLAHIDVVIICHLKPWQYSVLLSCLDTQHLLNEITSKRIHAWITSTKESRRKLTKQPIMPIYPRKSYV